MKTERIIWGKGIDRSRDPRYIDGEYDDFNFEVIERDSLSKRKGFGRWRTDGNSVVGNDARSIALMYDSDGNRYLFVCFDGASGTDLWIEKDGVKLANIVSFFPTSGYTVRWAVFGDRIYFVNGVDRPRWYKEYTGSAHVWGIAGVPSSARRPADESSFNYFISRALYVDCITSSEDSGIEPPGIWRYKQTIGYYGKVSDEQVEESNAGPASKMFHCQFSTSDSLGTQLQGYIEKGIPIGIADFDDLILDAGESGGQDYEDEIRWMRLYRQWKMFSDELFSPFEFLAEMKKGWPTSISDIYSRDSAIVAPTTRVQIPVSHHILSANNRLFLGRIEKELFTQPGVPNDFRAYNPPSTTYKSNFSYRMPVTIHNTNPKTLTGAVIPLRFQDSSSSDHVATPPSGGGAWAGAYIDTSLNLNGTTAGWYQMMFVDEDGVTPLGFAMIAKGANVITFLVEIPEIAAGGSRTIYIYFEDSQLAAGGDPESYAGEPGHWQSIAHYPLCASDHFLLMDFENWEATLLYHEVTQKRIKSDLYMPSSWLFGMSMERQTISDVFFNKSAYNFGSSPTLRVISTDASEKGGAAHFLFPSDTSNQFTVAFRARTFVGDDAGNAYVDIIDDATDQLSVRFRFYRVAPIAYCVATVYYATGGSRSVTMSTALGSGGVSCNGDWLYYAVIVDGDTMTFCTVYGDGNGHAAEGASWDDTTHYNKLSDSISLSQSIRTSSTSVAFGARVTGTVDPTSTYVEFKEMQIMGRAIDGVDELMHMFNRDTYFPGFGLATAEDRESQAGEKHPDRMYFSQLNQPNSFEAPDFRDMGELGRPIQGIKGIHNRLFVFDENKIRALFSAGAEQTLALTSGDTRMWNLSQDLTGEIGGLGVLAPDTLVTMEFAGRDGVGFLSRRGFYFFDGHGFVHISERVDESVRYHIDNYGKDFSALFIKEKRQLLITPTDILDPNPRIQVANMKFATDVDSIIWTEFGIRMKFGVELDEYIDDGDFVFISPYISAQAKAQILKLEGNSGADTYVNISDDGIGGENKSNVSCGAKSRYFDLFDAEMLHVDIENEVATPSSSYVVQLYSDISGSMAVVKTLTNPTNGENRFPIGTNARTFMVQVVESSSSAIALRTIDLYFNVHGRRRSDA